MAFMSEKSLYRIVIVIGVFILNAALGLSVVGCNQSSPFSTPVFTPSPEVATPTEAEIAGETPIASATPSPDLVVLFASRESDDNLASDLEIALHDFADHEGVRFERLSTLEGTGLSADVRIFVSIPPDPGISTMAEDNPQIQFLAVGIPDLEPANNLSVLTLWGERPDQMGFLAGYLAAVITKDWRVGVVSRVDSAPDRAARLGFLNGATFFCGLCRPAYPPFLQYPVSVELTAEASQEESQIAVDNLTSNAVSTVYIYPGAGDIAMLEALAQAGIQIIGAGKPPASVQNQWVASLDTDLSGAVETIWPDLIAGKSGVKLDAPLLFTHRNERLFSPGRQRLVEKIMADLLAGYIDTGVDPNTGEPR